MNTTDQAAPNPVAKDDLKALKDAYQKGASIDSLSLEYGYSAREVEVAVVTEVAPPAANPTQAEIDANTKTKAK